MSDLKSFWPNPIGPDTTLAGDSITGSGSDPLVTVDTPQGLVPAWDNPPVPQFSGEESPNTVSNLPQQPNRFEPNVEPPPIPKLNERRLTIDERGGSTGGKLND